MTRSPTEPPAGAEESPAQLRRRAARARRLAREVSGTPDAELLRKLAEELEARAKALEAR